MNTTVNSTTSGITFNAEQTVLVTGASGFLAAHVLNEFLDHGYRVRGTVRTEETAAKVRKTHAKYGDKLSFAIVEDVAAPGAFDEAVKGVNEVGVPLIRIQPFHTPMNQQVIHTASPFQTSVKDNEKELLQPAIQGTKGVLASIRAYNPYVRRVIVTSSFAAIDNMERDPWPEHTYTEKDWNRKAFSFIPHE